MESRNPVFNRSQQFQRGGYATFNTRPTPPAGAPPMSPADLERLYGMPTATAAQMGRMTLDDVVVRTAMLFAVLLTTAAATFFVWRPQSPIAVFGAMLVGFLLAMVASFGRPKPPVMLAYAAVEGVFVGGISYWYTLVYGNALVPQAILGTLTAFAAMLVLYKTGVVRNSPRFTRILLIAAVGYLVFGVLNLLLSAFGVWQNVYTTGGLLPVLLSGFGVMLASFFLVLDFDAAEQGIRNGLPQVYAWTAAFGLVVTLVWIYLEILRLLAILRGDD